MKSLADLTNFRADAFRLAEPKYVPESIRIGAYTFLPWVRTGIAAAVTGPAMNELRARIDVLLPVQADGQADLTVEQKLQVRGPGDVLGIDTSQIIRCYPVAGSTDNEDPFLAHIELDRPEMPWLVSPAAPAGDRLKPWIALVVLAAGRYDWTTGRGGLPPSVSVAKSELQPLDQDAWAWAHAQVIGSLADPVSIEDRLRGGHAPANLSRVVCPRQLLPGHDYLACLVPTYDAGVKAGLGKPGTGTLAEAWTRADNDDDDRVVLPVYFSWRFSTAAVGGNFESLAEKLVGLPAPWQVGRRVTETARPLGGLPDLDPGDDGRLQTVRGPLVSPQVPDAASTDPIEIAAAAAEHATWSPAPGGETELLRGVLNRPDELARQRDALSAAERPLVGPEIYARFHAARTRVESAHDDDWFGQLNLRPTNRVVAGLGTRVVQHDQEQLMLSAWAQVGAIDAANRQLRWAQAARFLAASVHERHLEPLALASLLQATRRVHSRVLLHPTVTVAGVLADSSTADPVSTPAFRRATRPLGPLTRFAAGRTEQLARTLADGDTPRDHRRPYGEPDGIAGISARAAEALDATRIADVLGVDATSVVSTLLEHGKTLESTTPVADSLPRDLGRATPTSGFNLSEFAGRAVLNRLEQSVPHEPRREPARAVALLALLGSMGRASQDLAQKAGDLARHVVEGLDVGDVSTNPQLSGALAESHEVTVDDLVHGFAAVADDLVATDWPTTPDRPAFVIDRQALLDLVDPAVTLTQRMKARIGDLPEWLPADWFDDGVIQPVMAAPVFLRPMYEALDDYSRNWLLPGLAKFPVPDLVTMLVSNAEFIEGFLAGLSHEMARELLWRGYPTDRRGTYFRRFWNPHVDELAQDLHRFTPTELGSHLLATLKGRVVLLVKGDLIRRYPDALVTALLAEDEEADGHPKFYDLSVAPETMAPILFHGHLAPDMVLVGFDLTVAQIKAAAVPHAGPPPTKPGWWFLVSEHPTAPRFGLKSPPRAEALIRDTFNWGDLTLNRGFINGAQSLANSIPDTGDAALPATAFGADAAHNAHLLLQNPVRAAFEAMTLLGPTGQVNP